MSGFIVSLTVLSVMFSVIGSAAVLFRRRFLAGREGLMYPLWIFILAISVVPLRFDLPSISDTVSTGIAVVQTDEESQNDNDTLVTSRHVMSIERGKMSFTARAGRALAILASKAETLSTVMFIIWLTGAATRFAITLSDCQQAEKLLFISSYDYKSNRMMRLLEECKADIGVKRRVRLRMLDSEIICSPCTTGCIRPVLYLEPGCKALDDMQLKCILAHELTHIKRCDTLLKLFTLFVSSVHWLNPVTKVVQKYVWEDCELACDYYVIRAYGNRISGIYMSAILDFAERFSAQNRLIGAVGFSGGFFFAKSANAVFLKKRYANMKNYRRSPCAIALLAAVAIFMGAVNTLTLSSCSEFVPEMTDTIKLSAPVEMMVRAYFGLSKDDQITPELLDRITTLEIRANRTVPGRILADFVVNGEEGYAKAVPTLALTNYWDSCVQPKIDDIVANAEDTAFYGEDSELVRTISDERISAIYCLKNPYDHTLTERALEELNLTYPVIREKGSLYIFDTFASDRELVNIYEFFDMAGLLDPWAVDSEYFDASCLEYFANLTEVTFTGFEIDEN